MGEDREAYIVYFKRTAFSRVKREDPKFDVFYDISGPTLISKLFVKAVQDLGIKPEQIDHVIVGNALQGGDNWSMGGRIPVFLAKFPVTIPAWQLTCSAPLHSTQSVLVQWRYGLDRPT